MTTYQHGGDIKAFAKSIGCDVSQVIDLSSNINHIKPKIECDFNSLDISAYPSYDDTYQAISSHYGISPENLALYNGASSAIFALLSNSTLIDTKRCYVYTPAYLEYKRACKLFGYEYIPIDRFRDMSQDIEPNSLVIFVNPSTPDGRYYQLQDMIHRWIQKDATIIIDESFLEFCDGKSSLSHIQTYNKLYIIKSMTKFYGSAGIRVGAVISNPTNISTLKEYAPSWQLSQFDITYIKNALQDKTLKNRTLKELEQNKNILIDTLNKSRYIKHIYPSDANYILVELHIKANEFQKILIPYKVMIRDCSNFDNLDEYHIRVAIKDIDSIEVLKEALS